MFLDRLISRFRSWRNTQVVRHEYTRGRISLFDMLSSMSQYRGDKLNFFDGFGLTADVRFVDLYTLQVRSLQLARENAYASAIFRRLETKIINTGLRLRCAPNSDILSGMISEEQLQAWTGKTEALWEVWGRDRRLCSVRGDKVFSTLQREAFTTAMISGDCLCVIGLNDMGLPVIELVDGLNIRQPITANPSAGHILRDGVELDAAGKEVAYYVETETDILKNAKRISAYTETGMRRAWLVRMGEGRINEVRGMPLLSVVMQNINELGKYLDSEQRAALVNSYIAMSHTRGEQTPIGSDPLKGAMSLSAQVTTQAADGDTPEKKVEFGRMAPGFLATQLAPGERIEAHDTKRPNVNFAAFAEHCIKTMSYALEIPPEILMLSFNSNYSASRQAVLQLEDYIRKATQIFTTQFNQPIYEIWLDGMVYGGRITAPGYLRSLRDERLFDVLGAWRNTKWRGLPKTDIDTLKQVKSFVLAIQEGFATRDNIADEYFGSDFDDNVRRLTYENEALRKAQGDLYTRNAGGGTASNDESAVSAAALADKLDEILSKLESLQGGAKA